MLSEKIIIQKPEVLVLHYCIALIFFPLHVSFSFAFYHLFLHHLPLNLVCTVQSQCLLPRIHTFDWLSGIMWNDMKLVCAFPQPPNHHHQDYERSKTGLRNRRVTPNTPANPQQIVVVGPKLLYNNARQTENMSS